MHEYYVEIGIISVIAIKTMLLNVRFSISLISEAIGTWTKHIGTKCIGYKCISDKTDRHDKTYRLRNVPAT
jgi:hypothetical protein